MTLFPQVSFAVDETHLSFAARLAATHIQDRMAPFLCDLGIKPVKFARGERSSVEALCAHAAVPAEEVLANTPVTVSKGTYSLRGEIISADLMSNPKTKFCPACLLSDDTAGLPLSQARRGRLSWLLRPVRTCARHGIGLESRSPMAWNDPHHEMGVVVPERGEALEALALAAPQRPVSSLQHYVVARLEGAQGPQWLDSQTLEQAVRSTELLGALLEFGSARSVSEFTEEEWERAGSVGFEFTSLGELGIREALYQVQREFRATGRQPQHRNVFGRLYEALCSKRTAKDMGDIKRIVREHIFDTVAVSAGEPVLGESLGERRLHTVSSLAKKAGLNPKTLANVLMAKGLVTPDNPSGVFEAHAGEKVAASMRRLVHVKSLPKTLNSSRPQADGLMDERILKQISTGEAGAPGRTQKAVDARDIENFLAALDACARSVARVPAGMVTIAKAAEKAKLPGVDIVHLILGGFLGKVVRDADTWGVAAIHVDSAEVRQVVRDTLVGVSPSQAAGRMGFPVRTVWALLDDEESGVLPSTRVHGPNGKHSFSRLEIFDLDRFRVAYLKSGDIANRSGVPRDRVEKDLRRFRVQPILPKSRIGLDLYQANDLPLSLLSPRDSMVA